ncbi:hypothetical protein D3C75_924670 [compost metagenome]
MRRQALLAKLPGDNHGHGAGTLMQRLRIFHGQAVVHVHQLVDVALGNIEDTANACGLQLIELGHARCDSRQRRGVLFILNVVFH